jgi:peptidyl-prolyl cis-trans isomerase SurA
MLQSVSNRAFLIAGVMLAVLGACACLGQNAAVKPTPSQQTKLDRVVAIVNNELILDSDVDEERRLEALQPYSGQAESFSRDKAIERLIDRDLILQQAELQAQDPITDAQLNQETDALRKNIPDCKNKKFDCETKVGWETYLAKNGFTDTEFNKKWRDRMEVLRFIEQRFRAGIKITPEEIQTYYTQTMLPEYARQGTKPPLLDSVSNRIQEVLLEQRVSGLLGDWLKSLRAQGSVVVLHAGEEAP